ncbi:Alpha/Beta hydrolase protein [Zychaea mexicana]|uniref:Alpha/Beta hydrolase protein n=1 Tax=Zychaea mexicana TaxID=64656 RepID=UPI0022FF29CF|nr:Alpha/Beta hydrolase protein [Zychaea mexicana]KAI9498363.1 Alpha/Beta hydrolase protein [Zychaea mexicana]
MSYSGTSVYFAIATLISCIPAVAGLVARWYAYKWTGILLYFCSLVFLFLSVFFYVSFRIVRHGSPFLLELLDKLNRILSPVASKVASTKFVGPVIAVIIRANFFAWFMILLLSDQVIRALIGRLVGHHASQRNYSIVNAVDPQFPMFDKSFGDMQKDDILKTQFQKRLPKPDYSQSIAYTLAVASKLAYEEVSVIKHELEKDGFDVKRTFLPMAFKNACAYIIEKDDNIFVVFRGTNPMNIQNFVTDFNIEMTEIRSPSGVSMGKVHKGFWEAMGDPHRSSSPEQQLQRSATLQIELSAASLHRTVLSTMQAATDIAKFTVRELVSHVSDPIDNSWIGYDRDIRNHTLYAQAEEWIMALINYQNHAHPTDDEAVDLDEYPSIRNPPQRKRFYIAGHSLGGALATVFLAKMLQSESPLLNQFCGLYTYGQPKVGDAEFTRAFYPEIATKVFHHAYNNDIVTRVPPFFKYYTPPGTLVFIDSAYSVTLHPPNMRTNDPVPVRPISYLHLSGLLNSNVIRRLPQESWLRVTFRLLFPFFLNDHFPSEYCNSLREGTLNWVIIGDEGLQGGAAARDDEESAVGIMSATPLSPLTKATRRHF